MWKAFREDPTPFGLVDTLDLGDRLRANKPNAQPPIRPSHLRASKGGGVVMFCFGKSARVCHGPIH